MRSCHFIVKPSLLCGVIAVDLFICFRGNFNIFHPILFVAVVATHLAWDKKQTDKQTKYSCENYASQAYDCQIKMFHDSYINFCLFIIYILKIIYSSINYL